MSIMKNISKRLIIWTIVIVLILILLIVMQFSNEINWSETLAYSIILLIAGGLYELYQWLKKQSKMYRIARYIGLFWIFFLGRVSGAIGIIGSENNPANIMYRAIPGIIIIGSLISQFKPYWMAFTLFITAFVQILVPIIALFIWPSKVSWGEAWVIGVFILNSIFSLIFIISALLFLRAKKSEIRLTKKN